MLQWFVLFVNKKKILINCFLSDAFAKRIWMHCLQFINLHTLPTKLNALWMDILDMDSNLRRNYHSESLQNIYFLTGWRLLTPLPSRK